MVAIINYVDMNNFECAYVINKMLLKKLEVVI